MKFIPSENLEKNIQYETENPQQNAINKFINHPSIKMIKSKISPNKRFSFCPIPHNEILKQIKNLNTVAITAIQYCKKAI